MTGLPAREFLRMLFDAAVAAADPARVLAQYLPPPPKGRTVVVALGKAAASMAAAFENAWPHPYAGIALTRYGHGGPTRIVRVLEAGHPIPDAASVTGAQALLDAVRGLGADDLVICLISGGGSALASLPVAGVTPEDKRALNQALLGAGAGIDEMNCVRKHVSAIKGGRLAAACHPAAVVTLAISDVPGDDPSVIASGPTVADATTLADARAVLAKFSITPPPSIARALADSRNETHKPGDPRLNQARFELIITPHRSLQAAAAKSHELGVPALVLGDTIEGEARECARMHAALADYARRHGQPAPPPVVLLSGGETTVTVRGKGRGGRNQEFMLALAIALKGAPGVHAFAADTDGIDGIEDAAGAWVTPDTLARAAALGLSPATMLANNDAYSFFKALGDLHVCGPTLTNVNDFRAILVQP